MQLQKFELPKRKTWNKEEYAKLAKDRKEREEKEILNLDLDQIQNQPSHPDKRHRGTVIKRDLLRPRKFEVNLNDKIGKRREITADTVDEERSGWYCSACKCQLKDSHTYLDHINGKKHQRMLGMSMKTPVSSLEQIKNRFEYHKKRSRNEFEHNVDVADRIEMRKAKEQRQKELKKQAKKRRKLAKQQAALDEQYGSIHNKDTTDNANAMRKNKESKDEHNESNETQKNAKKKDNVEYVAEGVDPEMEAMGFNFSFGGSKKT
mmetsp:Transcript_11082/g.17800  ORF Transcript_11082/g.17800 Transcript_11082/m.17800 type:complete len:263 (+) Transcript_11082:87-875(+)|eukprot:CAMPEP_0197047410 /NCGR_PEP_ID=MMETSP1384-20130603/22925_1 /TAXON_ID=29189 /ORGANISM="Ammonia sp." /LENGTH=262 /DNA_ID=CAMNT_0042479325 /DNA_START=82 /DNA_END=870 /DNA_ORIENTATION=-